MPYVHIFENLVLPCEGGGKHHYRAGGPYCVSDELLAKLVREDLGAEVDEDFVPPQRPLRPEAKAAAPRPAPVRILPDPPKPAPKKERNLNPDPSEKSPPVPKKGKE